MFILLSPCLVSIDPTPDTEARNSMMAAAKMRRDQFLPKGKRLVSDREWHLLHQEVGLCHCRIVVLHSDHLLAAVCLPAGVSTEHSLEQSEMTDRGRDKILVTGVT